MVAPISKFSKQIDNFKEDSLKTFNKFTKKVYYLKSFFKHYY